VHDDDGRAVAADRGAKHLGGAHDTGVDCALIDGMLGDNMALLIKAQHA